MTVNIPLAVCTYIVMYMVLEYYNGVSLTLAGLEWTCVYACLQPLTITPLKLFLEHVHLKQDVDSRGLHGTRFIGTDVHFMLEGKNPLCLCSIY